MGPLPNGYHNDECPVSNDPNANNEMFSLGGIPGTRCSISLEVVKFAQGNICIAISKDKQGLPLPISRCCDSLVHIPHLPLCGNTPLLDTPSSLSIMLSTLCESIGYEERGFHEHKFYVTRPEQKTTVVDESDIKQQRYERNDQKNIEDDEALGYGVRRSDCGDY